MEQFTNLYPLSKTLRFELIPHEKTKELLERTDYLAQDEKRAESYKIVKGIIDRYHKSFIEDVLSKPIEDQGEKRPILKYAKESTKNCDSLEEFYELYSKSQKSETEKKTLEIIQNNLRKQIVYALTQDARFKNLDKKELIYQDIYAIAKPEEIPFIKEFEGFATYFVGFHENRMNMYSSEAKSTAIGNRLINENLPIFTDNMGTFQKLLNSPVSEHFDTICKDMEDILPYDNIEEIFMLHNYNDFLTQKQITVYNAIIGGRVLEDGTKIQGINEYVNLYNQQQPTRETRLPKLKTLFKQILSDKESVSWLAEEFTSDAEMLKSIRDYYTSFKNNASQQMIDILTNIKSYDIDHIFIPNDISLTTISKKVFKDWEAINKSIIKRLKEDNPQKGREKDENYEERMSKAFKSYDSFSLGLINSCTATDDVCIYFSKIAKTDEETGLSHNLLDNIEEAYDKAKEYLNNGYPSNLNLAQDKSTVQKIKTLLDSIKDLQKFIKPLLGSGTEAVKDERFYGDISLVWEIIDQITPLYNKVRNRMTRKAYSTEKIKLNFENSTLLAGWDLNKERDNTSIILKKDGLYYLAIMRKEFNKVFQNAPRQTSDEDSFEKMEYKLLPGANKMLPKVFFSKSRIDEFAPSDVLIEKYKKGTHKKGSNFNIDDCHNLIDFFKSSIQKHDDWSKFNFKFSPTNSYEDMSGFYREVEKMGYKITFKKIPADYIEELVTTGKIFLFKIYNKDFSQYSKGTPNLHTLYWKMVFDDNNLKDVVFKLNGEAEIFYRKKSLSYKSPTHPAHQPIRNKNPYNAKEESNFAYDLIKDKRYTLDKFHFHIPITINFKSEGVSNINSLVCKYLRENDDIHFIGIDRGERHLLYVSVIDSRGRIKEQFSLNQIINEYKGNSYSTDYHKLLEERDEKRAKERQSWDSIESIKELKQGYLSQVIHKIASLVVKYNAVVVLEDLNIGFKRGRQKVESSIYQQFEKALIDKFNYLVDKNVAPEQPGGLMKGYQLTNKFSSFRDMGKQNGFLFYIPAWNTSKIDPVTGFVDMLHPKYESVEKAREFFTKFNKISYNQEKGWFEFLFDYNDFTTKAEGTRTVWTLCTFGKRIETFRNKNKNSMWDNKEIDLTSAFISLCEKYNVPLSCDMKNDIVAQTEKDFYVELIRILRLTLQMRNSITGTDVDYLISPVADENGNFYDSRNADSTLPENADANGAYNIARKGLWAAMQIRSCTDPDLKVNLAISNKEWLTFAQTKPYTK